MIKKISVMVLTLGLLTAIAVGCTPTADSEIADSDNQAVTVINVMHRWPPEPEEFLMGNLLNALFDEFEAANPDIQVNVDSVPSSMYESQLTVRLAAENAPDVYILWPGGRVESQLRKGDILDLTEIWEENDLYNIYKPGIVSGSTHSDGRIYTLPIEYKPNTFWYNKGIFEELGIEEPSSWNELLDAAEQCKKADYIPFAVGGKLTRWMPAFWFDYLLLNTAGGEFRDDLMWGKVSWESEEVYRVFELWKTLLEQDYFNSDLAEVDSKEAIEMVSKGQAAMILQGPWSINELILDGYEPGKDFDMFPFPAIDEDVPQAAEGAILAWGVNPNSDELEGAKRLMAFMAEYDTVKYLASKRNTLGAREDIDFEIYDLATRSIMEKLDSVTDEATLYMNFELATLPTMQDAGMDGIIKFMRAPETYKEICAELEAMARATFD